MTEFSRTGLLLGEAAMTRLASSRVAVFGVGGVGGYVVEALARSGIGALDLVDNDTVSLTNINRQIIALHSTIGRYKVDVARERVLDISPTCRVQTHQTFFLPETADQFDFSAYDYVVDAVDTVKAKIGLILSAQAAGVPIISPNIYATSVCPLARVMRTECRRHGIDHLKVLYSTESPRTPLSPPDEALPQGKRSIPGSTAYVPSVAGLMIASEVISDLISKDS